MLFYDDQQSLTFSGLKQTFNVICNTEPSLRHHYPVCNCPINCRFSSLQVISVPVGSALPATVKQAVAIGGGQILVAKSSPSVAKTIGGKQVVAQGVAKAIVSSGGGAIVAQPVQTLTKAQVTSTGAPKSGSQGSGKMYF